MKTQKRKVIIIGSGPAGYTAAIYTARAMLDPLIITGSEPGGQLTITTDVENYPGFSSIIQGPWLMQEMQEQAAKAGTEIIKDMVVEVENHHAPFIVKTQKGKTFEAETIVIATGAQAKWLGIKGEDAFRGKGVSSCATCDGPFHKDLDVCVIGGGNTAAEEALYLSKICHQVTLIHRRDSLRAEKVLQKKLFNQKNIKILWNQEAIEIVPDQESMFVEFVNLCHTITGEKSFIRINGVFVAIGHQPNTELFTDLVDMDEDGYIKTQHNSTATSVAGIFAAGDVQDKLYRQAVTAAASGCMAAIEIEKMFE